MTLVINLYGGPGTGKSTTAAALFSQLKKYGVNCELVHEFAKDLTWEKRAKALSFQPYVIGKQAYHVHRLFDEVDIVITDSPILLGLIYGMEMPPSWTTFLIDLHNSWDTLDIYIRRDKMVHPYNPKGRNQTEEQAKAVDTQILRMLDTVGVDHWLVTMGDKSVEAILGILERKSYSCSQ